MLEGFNDEDTGGTGSTRCARPTGATSFGSPPGSTDPPPTRPTGRRWSSCARRPGIQPDGAGALFVVDADGGRPVRITPWGASFLDNAWSPDGEWIVFQRPYGQLYLVHPDGSGLHRIPVELPQGAGARTASWSPDGEWIVFSMQEAAGATIWAVRPDGSDLRPVTTSRGVDAISPTWTS